MKHLKKLLVLLTLMLLIVGCAAVEDQGSQPDYESTKKMMVDMLKTDEGKQSIQEVLSDEEVKQEIILEQAVVRDTIQQVLTSEKGKEFWQELMQEPEFAKIFAESLQAEVEKTLKVLMKDPEYQAMMMDILQDPEMEQSALDLMKSQAYRQQVTNIMADAFQSPYFKAQVNEILGKVASEQMKKEAAEASQESEGQEEGQS